MPPAMNTPRSLVKLLSGLSSSTTILKHTPAPRIARAFPPSTTPRLFFTTTTAKMSSTVPSANDLIALAKNRRTYYQLNKDLAIPPARIQEIVTSLLDHVPSSWNSQSNRVVVLFGAEHEKLWDITTEVLKGMVPEDKWESTGARMAMFKAAAGSVLFFEDQTTVNRMQENVPLYADRFPVWAAHSDAMLQYAVWTALEAEGLGANIQHYNPIIDVRVAEQWKIPSEWKLQAQIVFGGKAGPVAMPDKTFLPLEEKFKAFGA